MHPSNLMPLLAFSMVCESIELRNENDNFCYHVIRLFTQTYVLILILICSGVSFSHLVANYTKLSNTSIQQSWLHLCLPHNLFLVHFFSHLASSALLVNFWQGNSLSIWPHRHRTFVVNGQGGHGPSWQDSLQEWGAAGWPHWSTFAHIWEYFLLRQMRSTKKIKYLITTRYRIETRYSSSI